MSDASHRIDAEELLAHAAWLRALARSLVRDEHAAEDVVQETFAVAVARPPREPGALRGWLARVARNAAWKSLRGERRRALREVAAPRRAAEPSADEMAARLEMQRALLDAVQELEPPYRDVVMLRFYDGKTPREIARELGVTPEVVWQRLSRATSMLRARLDRDRGGRERWAGVLLLWLDGRVLAKTGGVAATAAAVGTGVAIVGTKTVIALTAAAALGAWLIWPRAEETPHSVAAAADAAPAQTSPAPRGHVAPRVKQGVDAAAATEAAPEDQVPRAKVRGRVVDAATGDPIAGACVKVIRKSAGGGFQWALTTGADGTFTGEVEESKRYSAELDWSAVHSDLYVEASARGHIRFYEGPYTAAKGEDLGDVKLDRGVVVRGRVVHEDGRGVAGAHVYATCVPMQIGTADPLNLALPLGVADGEGRFELEQGLGVTKPNEAYTLLAACDAGVAAKTLMIPKGRESIDDVVLTVRGRSAAVRVLDSDGRPVPGAAVTALPKFDPMGVQRGGDPELYGMAGDDLLLGIFRKKTADDGVARFDALPVAETNGLYDFAATADGFTTGWARWSGVRSPAETFEIRLKREEAYVVGARIVDADGRPVEGALVTRLHADSAAVTTGADGVFVLRRGKGEPFGRDASVEIRKDGYAKRSETVWRWPDDGTKMGDIRLLRPAPIKGRVVDQDGRPIAGATVGLQRPEAWVKAGGDGKSDADGRFEFPDATEGEWALVVHPFGGGTWVVPPWKAVRGGDADVVMRLERVPEGRATVVVTVIDTEAGALVDVDGAMLVAAGPPSGRQIMGALPQPRVEHGRVTIERVAPGAHCLWLHVADRPQQFVRFRVADGETDVRATCRVRRGSVLTGRVRLPEGVTGTSVGIEYALADGQLSAGGPGWGAMTAAGFAKVAADGTFRIEGVTPAAYRLTANVDGWLGDVVVDATDGDAEGVVELTRGAVVKIPVPGGAAGIGGMRIEASLNGGAWTELVRAGLVPDRPFTVTKTLTSGTLRWRATFRATSNFMDPIDAAEPQSGEVVLEAGKEVEIAVAVVPRR